MLQRVRSLSLIFSGVFHCATLSFASKIKEMAHKTYHPTKHLHRMSWPWSKAQPMWA